MDDEASRRWRLLQGNQPGGTVVYPSAQSVIQEAIKDLERKPMKKIKKTKKKIKTESTYNKPTYTGLLKKKGEKQDLRFVNPPRFNGPNIGKHGVVQ